MRGCRKLDECKVESMEKCTSSCVSMEEDTIEWFDSMVCEQLADLMAGKPLWLGSRCFGGGAKCKPGLVCCDGVAPAGKGVRGKCAQTCP